jgi:hypothetical protein
MQDQTDPLGTIQIIVQNTNDYYFSPILQTNYKHLHWTSHSILTLFRAPFVYRKCSGKSITKSV